MIEMVIYVISVIVLLFVLYLLLLAPADFEKGEGDALWRSHYAHRGLHTKDMAVPENSMAAFEQAVKAGYGIEFDINLTADDKVVVFHDDTLTRMCGVDKRVADCTYEEIKDLTLLKTTQRIPLFEEVLTLVDGKIPLIVELKATKRNAELCKHAAQMLKDYQGPYCIESFHPAIVRWFCRNMPKVIRGQLSAGYRSFGGVPFWQAVLLSSLITNVVTRPHFVAYKHEDAHKRLRLSLYRFIGGKLLCWTVRDPDDVPYCKNRFDAMIFEFFHP